MGLVEGVVGGGFVQLPEVGGDLGGGAGLLQPLHELVLHRRHQVALLLADRLAQVVRLGAGRSRPSAGDLHQLLLVEDAAVGRLGDRHAGAGRGSVTDDGVLLALRVGGDVGHRAGPVEGDERDDVVELGRAGPCFIASRMPSDSSWKTPVRVAAGEHREGLGVVDRDLADVDARPARALDDVDRVLDHVEVAQAEEVHLQQADLLDRAHRVLGDDLVLALGLRRCRCRSGPAGRCWSSASCSGTTSCSGRSAITTAAAWIELLRMIPSRPWATSMIRFASGSAS